MASGNPSEMGATPGSGNKGNVWVDGSVASDTEQCSTVGLIGRGEEEAGIAT